MCIRDSLYLDRALTCCFKANNDAKIIYTPQATKTYKDNSTLLMSAILPAIGGINAPPQMAMTISPDISLSLIENRSANNVNTNGKITEATSPMINIIPSAITELGDQINNNTKMVVATVEYKRNFLESTFDRKTPPANVPNILPKKYRLLP